MIRRIHWQLVMAYPAAKDSNRFPKLPSKGENRVLPDGDCRWLVKALLFGCGERLQESDIRKGGGGVSFRFIHFRFITEKKGTKYPPLKWVEGHCLSISQPETDHGRP